MKSPRTGTTLIETLIYAALLATFIGATFAFVASIIGSTDTLLERNEVVTAIEFIERKLSWFAFHAASVQTPAPNASGTTLTFLGSRPELFPATFRWATDTVTLAYPGVAEAPLTNSRVRIVDFSAEHVAPNPESPPVLLVRFTAQSQLYPHLRATSSTTYALP